MKIVSNGQTKVTSNHKLLTASDRLHTSIRNSVGRIHSNIDACTTKESAEEHSADSFQETEQKAVASGGNMLQKYGESSFHVTEKNILNLRAKERIKRTALTAQKEATKKSAKTTKASAQAVKDGTKKLKDGIKKLGKSVRKTAVAGEGLIAAIIAGGWVSVIIIVLICVIAAIAASPFGIFTPSNTGTSGDSISIEYVKSEIEKDFNSKLEEIKSSESYDEVQMDGQKPAWEEVIAVYVVKVNMDSSNPQEVTTMTDEKAEELSKVFWDITNVTYKIEELMYHEGDHTIIKKRLTIAVENKTALQMADLYKFKTEQVKILKQIIGTV